MENAPKSPRSILRSLKTNMPLLRASVRREIQTRYQGSMFGLIWTIITPLLMLAVYTFVFSYVFEMRWGTGTGSKLDFALVLFAGMIVFNMFSECLNRAPKLIISNTNYVKKVIYPLEILPFTIVGGAFFHTLISVAVWITAYTLFIGLPHWTIILLPLVFVPLTLIILGFVFFISALGVYIRDVEQFTALLTMALMFLSPIFYPISALPDVLQTVIYFNPIAPAIELIRDVLYNGVIPSLTLLTFYTAFGLAIFWLGYAWFQSVRKGFADVL
jgi:lipopolysaccharide transport system permease protein